jgi:two-component system sensor histidine kinase/response regulator
MMQRQSNQTPDNEVALEIVEHSIDGLLVIDAEGVVQFANRAAVALFADRTAALVGSHFGYPAIHEPLEIILPRGNSALFVEIRVVEIAWEGRAATLASLRDVTERKRAEEALRKQTEELAKSQKRHRSTLEAAPDPIVVIDQTSQIVLVNAEAELVFGYRRAELLGKSAGLLIPAYFEETDGDAGEAFPAAPSHEHSFGGTDVYGVRKDGAHIPIEVRPSPTGTGEGGLEVMLAIRDLSKIRRAEAMFQQLLEAAPDGINVMNGEGTIMFVNSQMERMFGYSRDELLGRHREMLIPERLRETRAAYYDAQLADPRTRVLESPCEIVGLRRDGTEIPIEATFSLLKTDEGVLVFCSLRDVTQRKASEERTRQLEILAAKAEAANRAKSAFLSTMSHEIRTPMNAILGYARLMMRDSGLSADAVASLEVISRSGEHLLDMIDDILDLARIEAGHATLAPQTFDLRLHVRDLEAMFRLRMSAKGLQFRVRIEGEPVEYIEADEGKIRQILINLLGNAAKFTERGRVEMIVELNRREDHRLWLCARVEDTGVGMTAEEQNSLFQPFMQGQNGQRRDGTGLGLAISQKLASPMGGEITVSSAPGGGSVFRLEIPVVEAEGGDLRAYYGPLTRAIGIQAGQSAPRVLIADDVPDNRGWLGLLLTSVGFSVKLAENGKEAVAVWKKWRPQLILMDVHMPVMGGLEAARLIRSSPGGKETVIIALTADVREEHRRRVFEHEVNDFISKPCPENELLEKIRHHLGIEYVYERETGGADVEKENAGKEHLVAMPADPSPDLDRLRNLPADLIGQLAEAALNGEKAVINQLIQMAEERIGEPSALVLRGLADAYQYDRLIQLLENACPSQR